MAFLNKSSVFPKKLLPNVDNGFANTLDIEPRPVEQDHVPNEK